MTTELGAIALNLAFTMVRSFDFSGMSWGTDSLGLWGRQLLALVAGTDTCMPALKVLSTLHVTLHLHQVLPTLHHLLVLTEQKLSDNLDGTGHLGGIFFLPASRRFQDMATLQNHWRDNLHARPTLISAELRTGVLTYRLKSRAWLKALYQHMTFIVRMAF
jgi:hypothetical protein